MMNTKDLTIIAIFTALMGVLSPIAIPLVGGVDISLATLAVMLIAVLLKAKKSVMVVCLYIVLAFIGAPVLAGFASGAAILFGKTGGYIFGYIPLALITALFSSRAEKLSRPYNYILTFAGMVIGTVVLYALGTAWFMYVTEIDLLMSLTYCVFPFIPGDLLKMVIVLFFYPKLKKLLKN